MDGSEDAELAELAILLRERNAVDARIGRLLDRPVNTGSIGEWIAARIFDVELESAANIAGYDGHYTTGVLARQTVNVKAYTKQEWMLDINLDAPVGTYLVLTGPAGTGSALISSRGTLRPFCINAVYLLNAHQLHRELQERGVKIGIATSVRRAQWEAAEIYPRANNELFVVTDKQRSQLDMFDCG